MKIRDVNGRQGENVEISDLGCWKDSTEIQVIQGEGDDQLVDRTCWKNKLIREP